MLETVKSVDLKAVAKRIQAVQKKAWLALQNHDDEAVEAIQSLLKTLEKTLRTEIGSLSPELFKTQHLSRIELLVNRLLGEFENRATVAIKAYVPSAMRMNQDYWWDMAGSMRHLPSIPYPVPIVLPDSLLSAVSTLSGEMIVGLAAEVRKQTVAALGRAVLGAQTPFETARQISTIVGSRGNTGAFYSAERIVRTEVGRAYSVADEFFIDAATKLRPDDLPPLMKVWIAMDDDRTRTSHAEMHKAVVPADEEFKVPIIKFVKGQEVRVGSEQMSGPRSVGASAGNAINCRCTLVTIPEDILDETLAGFPGEAGNQ